MSKNDLGHYFKSVPRFIVLDSISNFPTCTKSLNVAILLS